jgi:alpha-amylase
LYRGQCNCGYWHGAFGGIYLPHLRNSIYRYLIQADNLLESIDHSEAAWVDAAAEDFNLDARQEVRLSNDKLLALLAPARGGHLYELDVRGICHNLLSTLSRRPEAYHRKVLAGPSTDGENVASIHDRIVFKQADLDQKIQYDAYPRKSLVDHFYDHDVAPEAIALGQAEERGDFLLGVYETRIRRGHDRVQVEMSRAGLASGHTIQVTKTLTLLAGQSVLEIEYRVDGLPAEAALHFSPEFGFAGLPAGADDRYFTDSQGQRLGQLGTQLDLRDSEGISLTDQWLGITVHLTTSQPGGIWTYPIETVSQSEGGFELVHQSVVVQPHWIIQGDAEGAWTTRLRLAIDTTAAQQRDQQQALEASHSS